MFGRPSGQEFFEIFGGNYNFLSQNRTVKNSNKTKIHNETPTHIGATYAITNFYQNF